MRRRLQFVFQDPASSLNPRLTVATALTEPMAAHGIGENLEDRLETAAQTLVEVQLAREHLWRYPHELSGGQRQRIGIARALCLRPDFVVCDEVTSALDVSVQAEVLQLLLDLRRERALTLLFITHDIGVVEYLSDTTAVMHEGRIVELGSDGARVHRAGAPLHPPAHRGGAAPAAGDGCRIPGRILTKSRPRTENPVAGEHIPQYAFVHAHDIGHQRRVASGGQGLCDG